MRIRISLVTLILLILPSWVSASDFTVRPFLIDAELEPRESLTETVVLTNGYEHRKLIVFATVNEITVDDVGEIRDFVPPVMTDLSRTVTSWVQVNRGRIEIEPGERVEVPLTVSADLAAEPGEYHAFIGFVPASKRYQAEEIAMAGEADGIILKVTVPDTRSDNVKINSFRIDRFVLGQEDKLVEIEVENVGDLPATPMGEVIFYDSRGTEVASAPVNDSGLTLAPGESGTLETYIPLDDSLGRYKANVNLTYGVNQRANLFDTTFFYLMPVHLMLALAGAMLFVALAALVLFRRVLAHQVIDEDGDEVALYVREGHNPNPKDHDIDLSRRSE
jgi:hypothetical protein